jgi:hypothetical protein
MDRHHPLLSVACWLGLALAVGPASGFGQTQAVEVTSDTPEYCLHLFDRVSELVRQSEHPLPREVTELSSDGQRMCDHGQTRGGIMRLRKALLLLQQPEG